MAAFSKPVFRMAPGRLFAVIAGLLLAGCAMFAGFRELTSDAATLSRLMSEANVRESVSIDGTLYVISGGEVRADGNLVEGLSALPALRLAYAKVLAAHNPLISLAGTEPDALEEAVDVLESVEMELAAIQDSSRAEQAVRTSLYPIRFLRAAADLERARLAFVMSGDRSDARAYDRMLIQTLKAFRQDLSRFRGGFLSLVDPKTPKYAASGIVIDSASIRTALDGLEQSAENIAAERDRRNACLSGNEKYCSVNPLYMPHIAIPDMARYDEARLHDIRNVHALFAQILETPEVRNSRTMALSHSACLDAIGMPAAFTVYPEKTAEGMTLKIGTAADIRFIAVKNMRNVEFYEYFAQRGVSHLLASPFLHYACPQVGADFGEVSALMAVSSFVNHAPLSAFAKDDLQKELLQLERLVTKGSILYETDARKYVSKGLLVAQELSLPEPLHRELISLALELRDTSGDLDQTILSIARTEQGDLRFNDRDVPADLSAQNLFFSRSGFLTLFMAHNRSVVGDEVLEFEKITIPRSKQPYEYFRSDPQVSVSASKLISDVQLFLKTRAIDAQVAE